MGIAKLRIYKLLNDGMEVKDSDIEEALELHFDYPHIVSGNKTYSFFKKKHARKVAKFVGMDIGYDPWRISKGYVNLVNVVEE